MQAELVERARDGDKDAFASLVSSSIDGCYALAYRILRDPHPSFGSTIGRRLSMKRIGA